jgi:ABC-2 type transport system permease protein
MFVIAMREYQAAVRTKAFLIGLILLPIMMGGGIVVQVLMRDRVDTADKKIAVVDQTSMLLEDLEAAAQTRNEQEIFKEEGGRRRQVRPRFVVVEEPAAGQSAEEISFALSERVRAGELFAFIIIPEAVLATDVPPGAARVEYYSNNPAYDDLLRWIRSPLNNRVQEVRLGRAGIDPELVRKATVDVFVGSFGLSTRDESGEIRGAKESSELAGFFVPMGFMMLMFMMILIGAQPLIMSVLEEKMHRISEVLLGSVTPFTLMMGKLVGMVGVSLTMTTIYLVAIFVTVHYSGFGHFFPRHLVAWFVVYQMLAVLMFGAVYIAIGAAVSEIQEAQTLAGPLTLVVMSPLFVWLNIVREPSAPFSVALSLFPPATPMLMILRQCTSTGVPLWQPLLGIVLVILTTILCVFAASRVFRVGILMQGKGAKLGEMMRWVIRG